MWTDMEPPCGKIAFKCWVEYGKGGRNKMALCVVDRVDGNFRATVGNLFGSTEIARGPNLELLLNDIMLALPKIK